MVVSGEDRVVGAANAAMTGGGVSDALLRGVGRKIEGVSVMESGLAFIAPNWLACLLSSLDGTSESWKRDAESVQHSVSSPSDPQQNLALAPNSSTLHCLMWILLLSLGLEDVVSFDLRPLPPVITMWSVLLLRNFIISRERVALTFDTIRWAY